MRRPALLLGFVIGILLTAGCDAATNADPSDARVTANAVEFDPNGVYGSPFAVIIDSPDAARAFAEWFTARVHSNPPEVVRDPGRLTGFERSAYLAVVTLTGCRAPVSTELHRQGADFRPAMLGGVDHPECYRPFTPFAVYEIPREVSAEITTVNGESLTPLA
ncbi:hypothetical protein [Nocardia sp. bgisy134]|uniref:hypothetical protein n=1 Tax=Nocardia sp. bgisy134 TaxID=3413789 RepID=UPI003D743A3E